MPNDPNPTAAKRDDRGRPAKTGRSWAKVFTPERVARWIKGEITLAELSAVSGPELLEMAVTGFSMYEQGRYDDARVIFDALCALDLRESYYRTALGAVYLAQEKLEQAEQLFNEAIRLNDREIASFVNRGEVYLRQGKIVEAAQDFKRAVMLDPMTRDPLTRRARLLAAAALQTLEAARSQQRPTAAQPEAASLGGGRGPPQPSGSYSRPGTASGSNPRGNLGGRPTPPRAANGRSAADGSSFHAGGASRPAPRAAPGGGGNDGWGTKPPERPGDKGAPRPVGSGLVKKK